MNYKKTQTTKLNWETIYEKNKKSNKEIAIIKKKKNRNP